jgi:hypothetical protein
MVHGGHFDVDIPVNVNLAVRVMTRIRMRLKPRWLVYQLRTSGATNVPEVIYAEVFWRKKNALKAARTANACVRSWRGGKYSIGPKRWARTYELPFDQHT